MDAVFDPALVARATALLETCRAKSLKIATAESCTGGLVAALLTEIAGSSDVFDRGFVTYSNAAKNQLLGVSESLIDVCGAVSPDVARAMADGALTHSKADIAVSITGIAGPGGGTEQKPVGLVQFACARRMQPIRTEERRFGDIGRAHVRMTSVDVALQLLADAANVK